MKKVKNGMSYRKNGWLYISVHGKPKERGYAYGYLCAKDFIEIQNMLKFLMMEAYGSEWDYFVKEISRDFKNFTKTKFKEFYDEMVGIAEGLNDAGCKTSIDEIIAWNFYCSIPSWYALVSGTHISKEGGAPDRCSAFIAVGDWTKDGKIVCAHNSFISYVEGQFSNVVLDINPEKGHRMIMQTSPCWIWSGTDFFVTSKGIIGTETTIGGFFLYEKKTPIGYRIRNAMQYGNTLDEYCEMLLDGNSGDYANSWLFGDIHTNEILRIELGLKYHNIERTKNGYFIGFNAPYDERIRNLEVMNSGFYDIRRHQGARLVRLDDLMVKYKGKIDVNIGKKIIADHYDVYLKKKNPSSRTVCSHYDLDAREYMSDNSRPKPYEPRGAVDGIVCDTTLAKKMAFAGKFGASCNIPFDKKKFCKEHKQYAKFCPYLKDRPNEPWTIFSSTNTTNTNTNDKHNHKMTKQKQNQKQKQKSKSKTHKKTRKRK